MSELRGEGIILTIDDSLLSISDEVVLNSLGLKVSDLIVHDTVLLAIVNELYVASAEAISINDQRLISTSGIKCVGPVIQVNNEKLAAPYTIKAIGNKEKLKEALNTSKVIEEYRKKTLKIELQESDEVKIEKYSEDIDSAYINIKEE